MKLLWCLVALFLSASSVARAESLVNPTPDQIELLYRYFNGDAPDFEALARSSDAVRRASEFDRQAALEREVARAKNAYDSMRKIDELVITFGGSFSEYDSARGGFPLSAFEANAYLPFRNGYSLKFDNYAEFAIWKLDPNAARAMLGRTNNSRSLIHTVKMRPFATDQSNRYIRVQVRDVTLIQQGTRNVLAELKSTSAPRGIANASALSELPPVAPEKLEIRGLRIGASVKEFNNWLAANKLFGEELWEEATKIYPRWFAASKTPYAALGGGVARISGSGGVIKLDKPDGGFYNFPGPGEQWNCKTDAQLEQTCGKIVFSAGNLADQRVVAIRFVQNISSNSVATVASDVTAKYGPYNDSFDVVLGRLRAKHYVWGRPLRADGDKNGLRDITQQNQAWQLSAIVAQAEANRVVLIVQMAKFPDSEKTGAANASRPNL